MVSPAEQKAFLDALFARGALPFEDVVLLLGRRGKSPPFAALSQALEFLRNERLFRIVHAETGQEVALDEAVFAQADRHALHLLGIEEKECLMAREHAPRIIADKVDVIEDKHRWASVEARNFVKIVGDPEMAMPMVERIRAFTHRFAWLLACRRFEAAAGLISGSIREAWTAEGLRLKIESLEKDYGEFECFDRIEVEGVYCGDQAGVNILNQMKLPKGIKRAQRRGEGRFELVSVSTPNGLAIHCVDVRIAIIDESQRFRICGLTFAKA